jgi:hypothetical protein
VAGLAKYLQVGVVICSTVLQCKPVVNVKRSSWEEQAAMITACATFFV